MSSTPAQPLDPPCQSETLTLPIDRRRAHPECAPWQMENPSIWVCFSISKALFIETSCECTGKSISSIPGLVNGSFPAAGSSSTQKTHVPRLGESSSNIKFTQHKIRPTRNSPNTKFTQHQIHPTPNSPITKFTQDQLLFSATSWLLGAGPHWAPYGDEDEHSRIPLPAPPSQLDQYQSSNAEPTARSELPTPPQLVNQRLSHGPTLSFISTSTQITAADGCRLRNTAFCWITWH